jgi:Recombination endonuclease VII
MAQGRLTGAQPRSCVICKAKFTPTRRKQEACPPWTGRNCAMTLSNRKRAGTRTESGMFEDLKPDPRPCEKCGRTFQPSRRDAKTCGADCPGRPDEIRACVNPRCKTPERNEDGKHLAAREFIVKGNSQGKGNQQYCSERCREQNAPWRLAQRFRRYGITPEQYQEMVAAQDNKCMICGELPSPPPTQSWREGDWALAADHDHETGQLRDLLCHRHNQGIGLFDDNPEWLRAAAVYVEQHRDGTCPQPWHAESRPLVKLPPSAKKARRLPEPPAHWSPQSV